MTKNISKTLIVGLGGTGQRVILDIKKRMLRSYGETPPFVQFLAFDTDEMYREREPFKYYYEGRSFEDYKYSINFNEFFKLLNPGLDVLQRDPICLEKLNFAELSLWLGRLINHPCCANRNVGRALFLHASRNIINILMNTINGLRRANINAAQQARGYVAGGEEITVYVIASLAGGMGSSTIMDVSRMLQIAGLNVTNAPVSGTDKIFGVFFLPRFFENKPHTSDVRINAYTALSELDYTLGLSDPVRYPAGSMELAKDQNDYDGF